MVCFFYKFRDMQSCYNTVRESSFSKNRIMTGLYGESHIDEQTTVKPVVQVKPRRGDFASYMTLNL